MKNNLTLEVMGIALSHMTKSAASSMEQKAIHSEYHRILSNAKDIGSKNPLLSAYAMGAWFIAMNRRGSLSPDENYQVLADGLCRGPTLRLVMGSGEHYLSPKRLKKQQKWAESTHRRTYENDWVVDVLPGNGTYDLGYDYSECGICKLCRDEGCPELTKYLCRLDYLFADAMGLRLERTCTLAEGGKKCDFRFSRK